MHYVVIVWDLTKHTVESDMQTFQVKITGSCFLHRQQDYTILIPNLNTAGVQECQ